MVANVHKLLQKIYALSTFMKFSKKNNYQHKDQFLFNYFLQGKLSVILPLIHKFSKTFIAHSIYLKYENILKKLVKYGLNNTKNVSIWVFIL